MNLPGPGDYIDIHTHGASPENGVYSIENFMAHEKTLPENNRGLAFTAGIHPWYLNEANSEQLVKFVQEAAVNPALIAIGEAGFDKLKGPSVELQRRIFEEQVSIAEEHHKTVVIHCVKAWDELLASHKKLKHENPWLIHGFRGKRELASQLISRGMYLSFWFDFALRPESADLFRALPDDRIFLETDGADVSIRDIYKKVARDLDKSVEELKISIFKNFNSFFRDIDH